MKDIVIIGDEIFYTDYEIPEDDNGRELKKIIFVFLVFIS